MYFSTTSTYLLAHYNPAQTVLKLHTKHPPFVKFKTSCGVYYIQQYYYNTLYAQA